MDVWRCVLTILIILLIVFPSSNLFSDASANAKVCQSVREATSVGVRTHHTPWQISGHWHRENIPQVATVFPPLPQNVPTDNGEREEGKPLEKAVNLLRSLLWRMTRHLQQLPIKSWLADLEANISHKSEEIAMDVETLAARTA